MAMARNEYLRKLLSPGADRWKTMLVSLALSAAAAGGAVVTQETAIVSAGMVVLALGAWVVGACAMVGYVRWYFVGEVERMRSESEKRE